MAWGIFTCPYLRWCQANLLIYNTIEIQIFVTTLPWSSFQIKQLAYLFGARILTFQKKKIIIWVVGSPGFKPWTLNPKKPSMKLWDFRVKHIMSLPSHAFQDDDNSLTKYVSIKGCNLLCKWSTTLLYTKPYFAHWMEKQLCSFLLSPNFLQRKSLGLDLFPTKMKFLPEGEEPYSKFHQIKLSFSNGN